MSGGGGTSKTEKTVTGPPEWMRPYWEGTVKAGAQAATKPYEVNPVQGVAGFSPEQLLSQSMVTNRAIQGGKYDDLAQGRVADIASTGGYNPVIGQRSGVGKNKFAGQNPYLEQSIDNASAGITRAYETSTLPNLMSQFNQAGAFGGTAHQASMDNSQATLASQLAQTNQSMRGADYDRQVGIEESGIDRSLNAQQNDLSRNANLFQQRIGNQMQAAGGLQSMDQSYRDASMLSGVGDAQQNQMQAGLSDQSQQWQQAQDYGKNQLNWLSGLIAGSPYQETTGPNPNYRSRGQGAMAGAAAGASAGAMAGGPWGALAGGVIGGAAGYGG